MTNALLACKLAHLCDSTELIKQKEYVNRAETGKGTFGCSIHCFNQIKYFSA